MKSPKPDEKPLEDNKLLEESLGGKKSEAEHEEIKIAEEKLVKDNSLTN